MERRPPAVVRVVNVRIGREQSFHTRKTQTRIALGGDTHCQVQQGVSVGAAFLGEPRLIP